ncbi:MAG: UDP-N-acetylglucosamine 2-epimerase, partial [Lachnospiraceae bacterium]|nr:UDP-N-acetylglucosamine 2-epimerase [Lachnospiraceae bacterium]
MKKLAIVTATRAEYGILHPLILRLLACEKWETQIIVTGTHLEEEFGYTCREIEQDGVPIYRKIPITEKGDDAYAVSRTMANALCGFGAYFKDEKPDLLILLGDRTEMLAIASAAMNEQIPIAHLHGGELTQGAVDECVRHALTKMSYLHFASAEQYRRRIIQMGEEPSRVFNVGALGVENILREQLLSRRELKEAVDFPADQPYAVVTFHPVTLEKETAEQQVRELLAAMKSRKDLFFLITKANSDAGGRRINELLEAETEKYPNMKLVASLGMKKYLSAVKYAKFVLGNSSSGII